MVLWLLILFLGGIAASVHAGETWMVATRGSTDELVKLENSSVRFVHALGSTVQCGLNEHLIALISHKKHTGEHHLEVIDRESGSLVATWPIVGRSPIRYLEGVSDEIVLLDGIAYFPTLPPAPNGLPASSWSEHPFAMSSIRLTDGAMTSIVLEGSANPRIRRSGHSVLMFEQPGNGIRKFDAEQQKFVATASARAARTFEQERQALRSRAIDRSAITRNLFHPSHGLFRLSRFGRIEHLLDANLEDVIDDGSIDIGSSRGIYAIRIGGGGVDIVYEREHSYDVVQTDFRSMQVARVFALPKTVRAADMYRTDAGAHIYWDYESGELTKQTANRRESLGTFDRRTYSAIRVLASTE